MSHAQHLLVEIDATLAKYWDPAKMSPEDQQRTLETWRETVRGNSAAYVRAELLRQEAALLDAICVRLAGEHGRIAPGTVLLETPGPRLGGKTQWLMPG